MGQEGNSWPTPLEDRSAAVCSVCGPPTPCWNYPRCCIDVKYQGCTRLLMLALIWLIWTKWDAHVSLYFLDIPLQAKRSMPSASPKCMRYIWSKFISTPITNHYTSEALTSRNVELDVLSLNKNFAYVMKSHHHVDACSFWFKSTVILAGWATSVAHVPCQTLVNAVFVILLSGYTCLFCKLSEVDPEQK